MSESKEILTMRAMAWQRAKGELAAYLDTFWPSFAPNGKEIESGFSGAEERISAFIKEFEENAR